MSKAISDLNRVINHIKSRFGIELKPDQVLAWEEDEERQFPKIMTMTIVLTEALAEQLKGKMHNNRPLKTVSLARYIEAHKKGTWELTHQGLAVSEQGIFVDGQHRVEMVLRTHKAVNTKITFGVSAEAVRQMDIGHRRTEADAIRMDGVEYAGSFVPMLRLMYVLFGFSHGRPLEDTYLIARDSEPHVQRFLKAIHGHQVKNAAIKSALFIAMFAENKKLTFEELVTAFFTGANLPAGSPILLARQLAFHRKWSSDLNGRIELILKLLRCFKAAYNGEALSSQHVYGRYSTLRGFMLKLPAGNLLRGTWEEGRGDEERDDDAASED
jgi:hypothetical protein